MVLLAVVGYLVSDTRQTVSRTADLVAAIDKSSARLEERIEAAEGAIQQLSANRTSDRAARDRELDGIKEEIRELRTAVQRRFP